MDKQKGKTKIFKHNSGITLIALVITIIVLLILAGVALATLTGNTSIIDNANKAVERYNKSADEDQKVLNQVKDLFAKYMGGEQVGETGDDDDDDDTPPAATPKVNDAGYATENFTVVADATNNIQIVIPEGFAPAILNGSNSTTSNPGQDGSIKSVMPAAQWSNITAAQINAGVVIKNAAGEEFVWVPIPNSSNFARTAWTTPCGRDSSGNWVDGTGVTHTLANTSTATANAFWEDTSSTEYQNMLTSVGKYKGFYIARYEASQGTNNITQSKRGVSPWVMVAQTAAITASSNNSISNTHLMYGIEWDSVLKWLQRTETKTLSEIQTNSNTWGNYIDSVSPANGSPWVTETKQNTGASEYWKANNIYDLAGNVWEWTQEKYSTGTSRAYRGGVYYNNGDVVPAASRYSFNETVSVDNVRFPFQLLLVVFGRAILAPTKNI